MKQDFEYLDLIEGIVRKCDEDKITAVEAMDEIAAIFKVMWDE